MDEFYKTKFKRDANGVIRYEKSILDDKTTERLIELSKIWVEENITNGLIPNTREDKKEPCFVLQ